MPLLPPQINIALFSPYMDFTQNLGLTHRWNTVATLRSKTDIVIHPFNVTHSNKRFDGLLEKQGTPDGEIKVVMEYTETHYESIANVLHEHGLCVSTVNPLLIRE